MLADAVGKASKKLGEAPESLRLDHLKEGRCVAFDSWEIDKFEYDCGVNNGSAGCDGRT